VLNFQDIEFSVILKDVTKFERLNNVLINVYSIEEQKKALKVLPIRLTGDKRDKHVNLLYMEDPRDDNIGHFAWIKNLPRLVSSVDMSISSTFAISTHLNKIKFL